MQRGAHVPAALSVLLAVSAAAGCVDLARPPELLDPVGEADGGDPAPPDPPDGPESPATPASVEDGAAPDAPAPEPDAPAVPDAPADGPADAGPPPTDTSPEAAAVPDAAPVRDAAPDAVNVLVIDNFADDTIPINAIGGHVAADNQVLSLTSGELSFVWSGNSVFQKFSETLRPGSCPVDIRGYRTLRFRMRASMPGQVIQLFMGRANPSCVTATVTGIGSVTLSTTMTTYTIDLGVRPREDASFFEWSPPVDAAVYFLDDIELHP
jgi:hypothetical protein